MLYIRHQKNLEVFIWQVRNVLTASISSIAMVSTTAPIRIARMLALVPLVGILKASMATTKKKSVMTKSVVTMTKSMADFLLTKCQKSMKNVRDLRTFFVLNLNEHEK